MLYDTKRFIFTVSLCAMLAVNPVLATAPGEEEVSTVHDVYTESTNTGTDGAPLNLSSGIAGVTYVNRMVNSAGNAAQRAEDHAAAAGASAIAAQTAADAAQGAADDAQTAADAATETLKDKVDISQGTDNKHKVMVVGSDGNLTPGMVDATGIANGAITSAKIANGAVGRDQIAEGSVYASAIATGSSMSSFTGFLVFGSNYYGGTGLYRTPLTSDMISSGTVVFGHLDAGTGNAFSSGYGVLMASSAGDMYWNQVTSDVIASGAVTFGAIADGAVTPAQTAGVVGVVPWGSADSTTYGQFWIE